MTLTPEVRDLLVAINSALADVDANRPALVAAVRSTLLFGHPDENAEYLLAETTAASDAHRVRYADLRALALAASRKTAPMMPACGHCGRRLPRFEAAIGNTQVCHPDDPNLPDCYHLVTVWHEVLGDRLAALRKTAPEVQR